MIFALCVCMEGFVPLYSCLRTLREWYRSQNCDIGGTTTTHNGPVRYEAVLYSYGTPTCDSAHSW